MTSSATSISRARSLPTNLLPASRRGDEFVGSAAESPTQLAVRRLRENRMFHVASALFLVVLLMCMAAPLFEKYWAGRTASEQNMSGSVMIHGKRVEVVSLRGIPNVGPGFHREYTLGADGLGRDVFMRILRGGSVSLRIGIGAAIITSVLGMIIGTIAGYFRGRIDGIISRCLDVLIAFPSLLFMIALSTSLASTGGIGFIKRGSLTLPLLVIGILGSFAFARVIRSKAMELGEREFVEAAKAMGAGHWRIMRREMMPHLISTTITWFGVLTSTYIITEAGLSFLGAGVLPPTPSWGNIIADGQIFYSTAWWIAFFPGFMIVLTVLSINLMGQSIEEAVDPKEGGR